MGYLVNNVCVGSESMAQDAYWTRHVPLAGQAAQQYSMAEKDATGWRLVSYSFSNGQFNKVASIAVAHPVFPQCDPFETFKDGQLLGWGVVAAMAAAWCVVNLKKGLPG